MIQLEHLTIRYGNKLILSDFSLTLPEKGVLCLMGPSGCGKTTLLRVILGLEAGAHGQILGLKPGTAAVMFQEDRLLPWFSLCENLTKVTGCSSQTAEQLLEAVELAGESDRLPEQLSGGMRRRVALARALAVSSSLLVLDEPFKGLDTALRSRLYPLIRTAAASKPVLLVTHDKSDAKALTGRILQVEGPPLHILKAPSR